MVDSNVSATASAVTQRIDKTQVNIGANQGGYPAAIDEEGGPFDEDGVVPLSHVADHHPDDVSSLQHSVQGKQRRYAQEPQEGAIVEEEDDEMAYYEEEDEEQQKAIRKRNILIILMLLMFLVLVVAIGVGVGVAVNNSSGTDDGAQDADSTTTLTDDDEYGGLGGGVEQPESSALSTAPSSFPSNAGLCIPVELGLIFDEYSDETGWMLVKDNYYPENPERNDIVWRSKYYNPVEYSGRADTFRKCFPPGYYTFVFTDKEGDGICCNHGEGTYVLSSEGKVIIIGGKMESTEESVVFELPFDEPEPVDANNDGRDDRLGWIMPFDSTNFTEGVDCENFRLVILTDQYGIETTWELYEGADKLNGELIADGGPYGSEYTYVMDYCLPSPNRYTLYMYDWDRRGLCCESGEGMYKLTSGDIVIHDSDGRFGEEEIIQFVLPADGSVEFTNVPTKSPTFPLVVPGKKTSPPTPAPVVSFTLDFTIPPFGGR